MQLGWSDICEVAHLMLNWKVEQYVHFSLSEDDVSNITKDINDLEVQRYRPIQSVA